MRRWLLTSIVVALLAGAAGGRAPHKRVTTRKHLQPLPAVNAEAAAADSGAFGVDTVAAAALPGRLIRFCGYEKSLRATKETFFLENLTDSTLSDPTVTVEYLDAASRTIHSRRIALRVELPPRQTRRVDVRSWDTQKSYYYINGPRPRVSATPYDVRITADTLHILLPTKSDL